MTTHSLDYIAPLFTDIDSKDYAALSYCLAQTPGYNRSQEANMLGAETDAEAIRTFLQDYRQTKLTYRSYLKEIERLVLWCIYVPKLTISNLKREHLIAYREFLADPEPGSLWCGPRQPRILTDGGPNPEWRPFASKLAPPSIRKVVSILDSFFNYLVINNYLAGNPMAVDKRRKGKKSNSTDRWLERDEIIMLLEALNDNLNETNSFEIARAKYIILTLFYTGLRLAEFTNHTMGHFTLIENEWFLNVVGKGEKPRKIVVVDEYLEVLANYRKHIGMPSVLPEFNETTPLVPAQDKKTAISPSRVWQIVKWAAELGAQKFEYLAEAAETNQEGQEEKLRFLHKASKLRKASPHWFRHSYGTYLVKSGCAIEKVKELMGHSDISTTTLYLHTAKIDLHTSARGLSLNLQP
jgi:site-specific recombinase XerD